MTGLKFTAQFILGWLLFSAVSCNKSTVPQEIIVGGDNVVMILDFPNSTDTDLKVNWYLKTSEVQNMPDTMIRRMKTVDDHKSVDNNTKILISSSSGGTIMVDRETKECLFYAITPNAHSVEYLPGDRIAVALSITEKGNQLQIYDADRSNSVLFSDSLYSGHGVIWIAQRDLLYALGYDELRAYSLVDWDTPNPSLKLEEKWTLPETGGHELYASSVNQLLISTSKNVWKFDLKKETFEVFAPLADVPDVKSIYFDEKTGHLIYTKGEISWWTHNIHSVNPSKTITIPEVDLYKVRAIK
ncbi:hypothetical protein SAMN05216364_10713 [Porphyromonadaceae bacterium KHP3R9]|jgi:hypothetical protein|nr:hypothetical protein SAMN05216364_10713 [Porphyromonadaceae bacterium KHP3R9]